MAAMNDACFIVRDKNGQALGYFYFEEEPGRRAPAHLLDQGRGATQWRSPGFIAPSQVTPLDAFGYLGGLLKPASIKRMRRPTMRVRISASR